jgi:hypothetical protein
MLSPPVVVFLPAHLPAKKLKQANVKAHPAPNPIAVLLQPVLVMLEFPLVTKKLFCADKVGPGLNTEPFTYKPALFTFIRSQLPVPNNKVLVKLLVPVNDPIIVLQDPVVIAQPAHDPIKVFWVPVVLLCPAHIPAKKLQLVVL